VWKDDVSTMYSVSSTYNILRNSRYRESSSLFEFFWKIKDLLFAHFTTWRVLDNTIASKSNLVRRGVTVDYISCCLCRIAWLVCNECYAWFRVGSIDHFDSGSHFLHFKLCNVPNYVNADWGSV